MSLYILDTDQLTLALRQHPIVLARIRSVAADQLAITIITAEEQLSGWYTELRKARNPEKLARAYEGLFEIVDSLKRIAVLPFTRPAIKRYYALKKSLPRIGSRDVGIAAIALECGGVLVTRNRPRLQGGTGSHHRGLVETLTEG